LLHLWGGWVSKNNNKRWGEGKREEIKKTSNKKRVENLEKRNLGITPAKSIGILTIDIQHSWGVGKKKKRKKRNAINRGATKCKILKRPCEKSMKHSD